MEKSTAPGGLFAARSDTPVVSITARMTTLGFTGSVAGIMVKQNHFDSPSPAPTAVLASIATDAQTLSDDLDVPLVEAVRVVVDDFDHVTDTDRRRRPRPPRLTATSPPPSPRSRALDGRLAVVTPCYSSVRCENLLHCCLWVHLFPTPGTSNHYPVFFKNTVREATTTCRANPVCHGCPSPAPLIRCSLSTMSTGSTDSRTRRRARPVSVSRPYPRRRLPTVGVPRPDLRTVDAHRRIPREIGEPPSLALTNNSCVRQSLTNSAPHPGVLLVKLSPARRRLGPPPPAPPRSRRPRQPSTAPRALSARTGRCRPGSRPRRPNSARFPPPPRWNGRGIIQNFLPCKIK